MEKVQVNGTFDDVVNAAIKLDDREDMNESMKLKEYGEPKTPVEKIVSFIWRNYWEEISDAYAEEDDLSDGVDVIKQALDDIGETYSNEEVCTANSQLFKRWLDYNSDEGWRPYQESTELPRLGSDEDNGLLESHERNFEAENFKEAYSLKEGGVSTMVNRAGEKEAIYDPNKIEPEDVPYSEVFANDSWPQKVKANLDRLLTQKNVPFKSEEGIRLATRVYNYWQETVADLKHDGDSAGSYQLRSTLEKLRVLILKTKTEMRREDIAARKARTANMVNAHIDTISKNAARAASKANPINI